MIEFNFNVDKAYEVILYLSSLDEGISKMRLLKYLFFADVYHINKYGRPILGDKYVAMVKGPVLSKLYNLIKHSNKNCRAMALLLPISVRKFLDKSWLFAEAHASVGRSSF